MFDITGYVSPPMWCASTKTPSIANLSWQRAACTNAASPDLRFQGTGLAQRNAVMEPLWCQQLFTVNTPATTTHAPPTPQRVDIARNHTPLQKCGPQRSRTHTPAPLGDAVQYQPLRGAPKHPLADAGGAYYHFGRDLGLITPLESPLAAAEFSFSAAAKCFWKGGETPSAPESPQPAPPPSATSTHPLRRRKQRKHGHSSPANTAEIPRMEFGSNERSAVSAASALVPAETGNSPDFESQCRLAADPMSEAAGCALPAGCCPPADCLLTACLAV